MTTAKPAWEIAWERAQPAIAKVTTENQDYIGTILRDGFRQGHDAHAREQERAVIAGRKLLLEIGGNCEESWQQNDLTFERAAELAEALALVVGRPELDEETGDYKYAPEETKPNEPR